MNLLQLTISLYMMQVFDRVMTTRSLDTLAYLTLIAAFALLILAVLEACRAMVMQRLSAWIEARSAPEAFTRAIEAQLAGGPYRMEALRDLAACRGFFGSPGMLALFDVPWVPVYLAMIFLLHPALGWMATAGATLLLALALLNEGLTRRALAQASLAALQAQRRMDSIARNAEAIEGMGMTRAVLARWEEASQRLARPQRQAADRGAILLSVIKFSRLALQLAIMGGGAWLVLDHQLSAGASVAASIVMGRALAPVEQVVAGWKPLVQARQALRRLQAFLALPRLRPEGLALPAPAGALVLERVSWTPPGRAAPFVKAVTLSLPPGESLGIIGPSAAGKTTLLRLIIGTLQPSAGDVRLDGAELSQWRREELGRHLGYLPQDVELFDGTVLENIARLEEGPPEAAFAAARLAGCHEMILRLPQGYETLLGEGGTRLSGGQRQMIGLARAFHGQPRVVVLDEPNAHLDGDAEKSLLAALEQLRRRRVTVVLVTHNPALVQGLDHVLVMRDGAAELFGPREAVLRRLSGAPRPALVQGERP
ncbi:type I secretion system permease/ATPase [Roseococcus sp. YIM B11640]|uniref:type I secretion system permease/ATPase n=1 Tax=Roseococcus sp. YIM B11640 TaxID=3133973 RepID=UPI003C7AD672